MTSKLMLAVGLSVLLGAPVGAQERGEGEEVPDAEVGMRGGVTHHRFDGTGTTVLELPGGRDVRGPSLYGTFFMTDRTSLEPQLGFTYARSEYSTGWLLAGALQVAQWMAPPADDSPYAFMHGSMLAADGGDPTWGLGGGAGYRWIVGGHWGVRLEGRYRRLFSTRPGGADEFSLGVGVGAMIRD